MPKEKIIGNEYKLAVDSDGNISPNKDLDIVWQPDSLVGQPLKLGKQWQFLTAPEDWVGIDGGKGSGKTDLLIFDCMRPEKLMNPQWHGVIYRREYKRLTEVIDRAHYWFKRMPQWEGHWQGDKNRFVFPSGAWLAFHNCELEEDVKQYQGWQICDLKFDQLEEFLESQFNFLALQNRNGDPQRLHSTIKWTANPVGVGRNWIKKRFVDGKPSGSVTEFAVEHGGKKYVKRYRRIFATVFDNPLLASDSGYIATLASEPNPYLRKALFEGSWDVISGQFFNEYTSEVHLIHGNPVIDKAYRRLAGCDYGNVKVMEFLAMDYEGNVYVEWEYRSEPNEMKPAGETASEFAEHTAEFMLSRGIGEGLRVVGDTNMWSAVGRDVGADKTPAIIIQNIWNKRFKEAGKKLRPILVAVSKRSSEEYRYRVACNEAVRDYLHYEVTTTGELTLKPRIYILDRCQSLVTTMGSLVTDDSDPMDILDGQDDHSYDAFKMPFMEIRAAKRHLKKEPPKTEHELLERTVFKKAYDRLKNPKTLWHQR